MERAHGARMFRASGEGYDRFMGRYSRALAPRFADAAGVSPGRVALDVGCGAGALTQVLVARLGAGAVCAVDPSPTFVEACATRLPGVDVRTGRAEDLPVEDATADITLAQLVLPFVDDAPAAVAEMRRATRPGGTVAACIWELEEGMRMLRAYWDAALALDPSAPDEARTVPLSRDGEVNRVFRDAGLVDIEECTLEVQSAYRDFDELWRGFLEGVGPAGTHCVSLAPQHRERLRAELYRVLGQPQGGFSLGALARCTVGRRPRS